MAIVYYPKQDIIMRRDTVSASYEQVVLSAYPNTIMYFGSGSELAVVSSSTFYTTASQAESASHAVSASYALNGGGGGTSLATGSTYPFTSSWAQSSSVATSASYAPMPTIPSLGVYLSSSWTGSNTSQFSGTASHATTSSYAVTASYAATTAQPAGVPLYYPRWSADGETLTTSSLVREDSGTIVISEMTVNPVAPDGLAVKAPDNSYNGQRIHGNSDSYFQLNLKNFNNAGVEASSDLVATADDGTETTYYLDLGINSSTYDVADYIIQGPHDGYLYSQGGNLVIGTKDPAAKIVFHAGGTNDHSNVKAIITPADGLIATGSLYGTASLAHTASTAISSSYAATASVSTSSSYSISSSFVKSSSLAAQALAINPGATFYVASGSNGVTASYIDVWDSSTVPYDPPYREGRMFFDSEYSTWVYYPDHQFKIHMGKEVIWRVHNASGAELTVGTPVYISGSVTGLPDVYMAVADGTNTKSDVVGVIRHNIPASENGYVLQAGVIHGVGTTGFAAGDPLYLGVEGGLTNVEPGQPYESVRIGNCQVGLVSNGSIVVSPVFKIDPVIAYAGMTTTPTLTNNDDGTITISSGSVNLFTTATGYGGVVGYAVAEETLTLVTGSTNYVYAAYSESRVHYILTTAETDVNGINRVPVFVVDIYTGNPAGSEWDVHAFNVGIQGLAMSNQTNNKDIRLYGYQRESGFTLYTTGSSGSFGVTDGKYWYGSSEASASVFDTTLDGYYTYIFETTSSSGTGSWFRYTSSIFISGYYDSGSSGLTPCAPDSWSVNFVYRLIGADDEAAIVVSGEQFATETDAKNDATIPADLPSTLNDNALLVGRLVVQSGSYAATIQSAFTTVFAAAAPTNHESLTGLQGGAGGEHYHMTLADYTGTGEGVMVRAANATMSNPMFQGATTYHIPYWDVNERLTLTGSVQVFEDQHVLINSASFPDPTNREALLVKQLLSASVNVIGSYATVNDFSQIYNQNYSSGPLASTDFCATNDDGDQYTNYIDMGVASSTYSNPLWPWTQPYDGYVMTNGGDLWLATTTAGKVIRFAIENTASVGYLDQLGAHLTASIIGTSSWASSASIALSASYAPSNFVAGTMDTGSTYPITSSQTISASFWNSSSIATILDGKQWNISTGSTLPITASWALSASYAPSNFVAGTMDTGSTYPITASYAVTTSFWDSSSIESVLSNKQWNIATGSTLPVTSSWATSASYAPSTQFGLETGSTYPITSSQAETASVAISSSYALSASYAPSAQFGLETGSTYPITASWSVSASWAPAGTTLVTASTYPITASWAESSSYAVNSRWLETGSLYPITASHAVTSSYTMGMPVIKSGIVSGSSFGGTPQTASIVFVNAFANNNYSVVVSGEPARTWTIQNKDSGSFEINSNNNTSFATNVFWQAITTGEFYS